MSANAKISTRLAHDLADEKKAHKETRDELSKWKADYKVLSDTNSTLLTTIQELEAQFNKMYQEGSLWYYDENDFIVNAIQVEPYHMHTYPRDIDLSVIQTSAYQRFPYYKKDFTIDSEQYKKYLGGII